ncbi:maleylpyruvate isomerase family mycothiol-dependent enzyme [Actinomycetospora endophytica]|uniref:Maleylpyruvate isomerase family mycothiol-dependent enzyme n=1 Tax=Actinomycetospora endophytica TaxID=2291215 RepID=A0ABS8PEJ5_9PSEU|nr:maleylpyruvate isomerase family mycothiol-dependent enzyme [Actinomycetospora endophytica]MCD2195414.1 maleylpyruvate isomerase family mycothiol-dependent enzyme [Actinomycetospora endophytica]
MLTAEQARTAVARDWARTLAVLDELGDAGDATPTRCAGWTLTDLARHGAWGTSMEADALRRARTGTPGTAEGREPDGGAAAVTAALRASVADLDAELAQAGDIAEGTSLELPFGPVPAAFGLAVFTMEAGFHADDAVAAAGRDEALGEDVVGATTTVLPLVLPVLAAAAGSAPPAEGTVLALRGPAVELRFAVVDGAWAAAAEASPAGTVTGTDDTAVLRFALGRAGTDDPRLTVDGLAAEFKAWFPGP